MKTTDQTPLVPCVAVDRSDSAPLYRQVYSMIRTAVLDGRLRSGQRLPSTRRLAEELGVSRLPILIAFEQLLLEGYLVGRVGAGTYVSPSIGDLPDVSGDARSSGTERRYLNTIGLPRPDALDPESLLTPFRVSLPALDQFPRKTWPRLVSRHTRRMSVAEMAYSDPAGYLPLRQAIATYLRTARAVQCEAEQVLIVSGSQMALRLCAMALLKRGDEVCVENPGYPGARGALSATGARVRPVHVDSEGVVVRSIVSRARAPRVVHVTPSHQYPLGMLLSASRRLELLEWARRHRTWIIEDDYDSEYRFDGHPLGALQGLDRESRVIYIGTFSKVLFPALRIGYAVVPPALQPAFIAHRESLDLFSPTLLQLALTDFLREGYFARHVRRMRAVYRKRKDALLSGIRDTLSDVLSVTHADGGMHLTAALRPDIDDCEIARRAASCGISVTPLSTCYAGRARRKGLVLGFGGFDEAELARAVHTLAAVISACRA
jgi:GntR family transcriptional regulator / MocR family aminotransferase